MVALHDACQALYSGECTSAVVAGSNLILTPTMTMSISDNMILSPDGICKTFDASADGYGRGEAVNAVCIKRLDDALRDGDQIRAVIRSSMVNHDGRSPGITTPSADAQARMIRETYKRALISDLSQTAFIECHGTGTLAGDPIECSAIAKTFPGEIYIGSVRDYPAQVIYRQEFTDSFIIRSKPMLVTLKEHQGSRALSRLSSP